MKWTKTTEKLPPDNLWYFTRYSGGSDIFRKLHHINGKWFDEKGSPYGSLGEIEWLDESTTSGVLLQTEELEGLCKMAFNQGIANAVYGEGSKEYMSFENWIEENLTPAKQK